MNENREIDTLISLLRNGSPGDPDAEWQAAIELGAVTQSTETEQAVNALTGVLESGTAHALTRAHAVESLGRLGNAQAVPTLVSSVNDPYRLVRSYAVASLGELGDSNEIIDLLLDRIEQDVFFGVRAAAASSVAAIAERIGDASITERVIDVMNRHRAAELEDPVAGSERVVAEIDRSLARLL